MAFRVVAKSLMKNAPPLVAMNRALSTSSAVAPAAVMPSAYDSIIHLTFVDPSGARRKVPGYIGEVFHVVKS